MSCEANRTAALTIIFFIYQYVKDSISPQNSRSIKKPKCHQRTGRTFAADEAKSATLSIAPEAHQPMQPTNRIIDCSSTNSKTCHRSSARSLGSTARILESSKALKEGSKVIIDGAGKVILGTIAMAPPACISLTGKLARRLSGNTGATNTDDNNNEGKENVHDTRESLATSTPRAVHELQVEGNNHLAREKENASTFAYHDSFPLVDFSSYDDLENIIDIKNEDDENLDHCGFAESSSKRKRSSSANNNTRRLSSSRPKRSTNQSARKRSTHRRHHLGHHRTRSSLESSSGKVYRLDGATVALDDTIPNVRKTNDSMALRAKLDALKHQDEADALEIQVLRLELKLKQNVATKQRLKEQLRVM